MSPAYQPPRLRVPPPAAVPAHRAPQAASFPGGAAAPAPRPRLARGKAEEEAPPVPAEPLPAPAPLILPAPGALGLAPPPGVRPGEVDWAATRRRLDELGAVAFQLHRVPEGGWRFVCQLATAEAGRFRRIEAGPAPTEGEAVSLALAEAGRWVASRR